MRVRLRPNLREHTPGLAHQMPPDAYGSGDLMGHEKARDVGVALVSATGSLRYAACEALCLSHSHEYGTPGGAGENRSLSSTHASRRFAQLLACFLACLLVCLLSCFFLLGCLPSRGWRMPFARIGVDVVSRTTRSHHCCGLRAWESKNKLRSGPQNASAIRGLGGQSRLCVVAHISCRDELRRHLGFNSWEEQTHASGSA